MFKLVKSVLLSLCLAFFVCAVEAQIRLPKIIGSNMVLQRKKDIPIWGWATAGKTITLNFAGKTQTVVVGGAGYFQFVLSPMEASDKPRDMEINSDTSHIKLTNILIGEVWLCSGQSNMEYIMKRDKAGPAKGIDSAALELAVKNPMIRLFKVEKKLSKPDVTTTGWNESGGTALEQISAPGYYFAKNLYNKLHVPIGLISSSWGGSRIEPWTPPSAYTNIPVFKDAFTKQPLLIDSVTAGADYASMIKPLAPFAIKGFLWYQGESNCMTNEGIRYADKMQALVESWRYEWRNEKLPFYSVLIAPYYYTKRKDHVKHTPETLPEFWEAQIASLDIPNTEIISVTDLVDNLADIHPSYKWEVGRRLALVAYAKTYGYKKTIYSGPRYKQVKFKGDKAVLSFTNADGLKTNDGQPLNYFTIAGADGKFVEAKAEISGNKVIVSGAGVSNPTAVRFAWIETARPNFVNGAGLPAFPFRTDNLTWKYLEQNNPPMLR